MEGLAELAFRRHHAQIYRYLSRRTGDPDWAEDLAQEVFLDATVALSVLVHGVTAAPLARRYASWFESHPAESRPAMESVPAEAHRLRGRLPTTEATTT